MVEDQNSGDELSLNIEEPEKESGKGGFAGFKAAVSVKMIMIFVGVIVLIGGLIVGFLVFQGGGDPIEEPEIEDGIVQEEAIDASPVILFDDIVKLEVVEIKLGDMGGERDFRVGISLKIDQQETRDELVRKADQVNEILSVILKSKTFSELQGAEGKIILRYEMIKHLNEFLETGHIINLFFYDYLIL